jgi:hypothetical protein
MAVAAIDVEIAARARIDGQALVMPVDVARRGSAAGAPVR